MICPKCGHNVSFRSLLSCCPHCGADMTYGDYKSEIGCLPACLIILISTILIILANIPGNILDKILS